MCALQHGRAIVWLRRHVCRFSFQYIKMAVGMIDVCCVVMLAKEIQNKLTEAMALQEDTSGCRTR
jgi:hypothetical protein